MHKIQHNELSKEAKSSLKKRTYIGLLLLFIAVPCVVLGGWFFLALILVIVGIGTYEVIKAPRKKLPWYIWLITFIIMYALIFWVMIKVNVQTDWKHFDINTSFSYLHISPYALAVMVILFFLFVVIKEDFKVSDACYLIAMTLLLALGFQSILFVRYIPFTLFKESGIDLTTPIFLYLQSTLLLIYLAIAIMFNDIGAYIFGILFGKHKMNPRISPKKTWEGFFGGVFFSLICSMMFALIFAHFNLPMLPKFDISHWYWILLTSLILPLIGNLGDFTFSAIKRNFNIKDFSRILGPHGGILDRFDSLIFGTIMLAILIIFITNNWNFFI